MESKTESVQKEFGAMTYFNFFLLPTRNLFLSTEGDRKKERIREKKRSKVALILVEKMGDSFKFYNPRKSNFVRGMKTRRKEKKMKRKKRKGKERKRKWRVIRVELRTIKVYIDSNSRVEIPRFGDFTKLYVRNKKWFSKKESKRKRRERNEIWKNEKDWKEAKKNTRKIFAVFIFKWGTPEDENEKKERNM